VSGPLVIERRGSWLVMSWKWPKEFAGPARYEIRVAGVLDSRWAAWFNGLQIRGQGDETVICGLLADQPALHGLLTKVRDLGLCLISVRRLDTSPPSATTTRPKARPEQDY
jgi:hypothetical protein